MRQTCTASSCSALGGRVIKDYYHYPVLQEPPHPKVQRWALKGAVCVGGPIIPGPWSVCPPPQPGPALATPSKGLCGPLTNLSPPGSQQVHMSHYRPGSDSLSSSMEITKARGPGDGGWRREGEQGKEAIILALGSFPLTPPGPGKSTNGGPHSICLNI